MDCRLRWLAQHVRVKQKKTFLNYIIITFLSPCTQALAAGEDDGALDDVRRQSGPEFEKWVKLGPEAPEFDYIMHYAAAAGGEAGELAQMPVAY